jgi:hypothetical protein
MEMFITWEVTIFKKWKYEEGFTEALALDCIEYITT